MPAIIIIIIISALCTGFHVIYFTETLEFVDYFPLAYKIVIILNSLINYSDNINVNANNHNVSVVATFQDFS